MKRPGVIAPRLKIPNYYASHSLSPLVPSVLSCFRCTSKFFTFTGTVADHGLGCNAGADTKASAVAVAADGRSQGVPWPQHMGRWVKVGCHQLSHITHGEILGCTSMKITPQCLRSWKFYPPAFGALPTRKSFQSWQILTTSLSWHESEDCPLGVVQRAVV